MSFDKQKELIGTSSEAILKWESFFHGINWDKIKHFKKKEWGKDANRVNFNLIYILDAMREDCKRPIIIHSAYATTGHSPNSYHYRGMAVDFHIKNMTLLGQFLIAERFGFGGIGIYPFWKHPGLHCDIRHIRYAMGKQAARWWRDETGAYRGLSDDEFKKCLGLLAKLEIARTIPRV